MSQDETHYLSLLKLYCGDKYAQALIDYSYFGTRQIIRYRATATLRRPQIKQYTISNERGLQNQREHHIILTNYETTHPTAVSENYSSSWVQTILIKVQITYMSLKQHTLQIHGLA